MLVCNDIDVVNRESYFHPRPPLHNISTRYQRVCIVGEEYYLHLHRILVNVNVTIRYAAADILLLLCFGNRMGVKESIQSDGTSVTVYSLLRNPNRL
jgi:hypothetical protein